MKPKYAIGIAVNGNEVRAAFLSLVRGKACIQALESIALETPLEDSQQSEHKLESLNELEKAFDINDPLLGEDGEEDEPSEETVSNNNVSRIYSLVDKFQNIKTNVAINAPILTVKYDFLEKDSLPKDKNLKKKLKEKFDQWGYDPDETRRTNYLNASDGKILQLDYEHHPPMLDVIEEVNQFRAGNLKLVLMDTNELALVDLVKEIYKLKKDEVTAIIHIEQDFSRVIFLKGQDIYHITPVIHKGSMSDDVLAVIYRRIIFAQDHHLIPELNKILVAGHSSKLKAKYYFRQKFPSAITGYLNSRKIQSKLRFKDRGLLFSRYAVAIALAWKALQRKAVSSKQANLLPEYLAERRTMPKLAVHGYLLLLLLAMTAFSFTWMLVAKNVDINQVTRKINLMKLQIDNNKSLTDRVKSFDGQIIELENKMALVDSFSQGYERTLEFLTLLNKSVGTTGNIWVTTFKKQNNLVAITGIAKRRENIPLLANSLGGANLKKVTRAEFSDSKVFTFQLEKDLDETAKSANSGIFSFIGGGHSKGGSQSSPSHAPTSGNGTVR